MYPPSPNVRKDKTEMEKEEEQKAIRAVEAIFERYNLISASSPAHSLAFDRTVMSNLKILTASPNGSVSFSLLIDETYANLNGVMHGGAAGVIFDMATTTALGPLARPGFWDFMGGVTRSLNISYLKAIPIGTTIHIHSRVIQAGRTMAFIRGQMTSATDEEVVYCTCEHHKVNVPTLERHLGKEFRVGWDGLWESGEGKGSKL